jgi:hypothetical protein
VALWSEGAAQPELWRLVVTADRTPMAEKWDAAKLERRLAELFPGNHVALVPLSHEVLVKGDAASADEAERILAFVRGNVEHSPDVPPSRSIRLAAGTAGDQDAEHRTKVRVVDRLNVPPRPVVRVGLTVFALDRERLDALGVDLNALVGAGPRDAEPLPAAAEPLRAAALEAGEMRVLLDWLTDQGAATRVAQSSIATPAGHTVRFALSAVRQKVEGRVGQGAAPELTLAIVARPGERRGIRLRLDAEVETRAAVPHASAPDIRDLVRITRRFETESAVLTGQVVAAVLRPGAASAVTSIQVPLLGELAFPVTSGPQSGEPARESVPDVLIILAPESLPELP